MKFFYILAAFLTVARASDLNFPEHSSEEDWNSLESPDLPEDPNRVASDLNLPKPSSDEDWNSPESPESLETGVCRCTNNMYTLNGNDCYRFVSEAKTFNEARNFCRQDNAKLAEPNSRAENDFVASLKTSTSWLGVSNRYSQFRYDSDNDYLDFVNWEHRGYGSYYRRGYAATIGANNKWRSYPMSNNYYKFSFVCEQDAFCY